MVVAIIFLHSTTHTLLLLLLLGKKDWREGAGTKAISLLLLFGIVCCCVVVGRRGSMDGQQQCVCIRDRSSSNRNNINSGVKGSRENLMMSLSLSALTGQTKSLGGILDDGRGMMGERGRGDVLLLAQYVLWYWIGDFLAKSFPLTLMHCSYYYYGSCPRAKHPESIFIVHVYLLSFLL